MNVEKYDEVFAQARQIAISKGKDYGANNIGITGITGISVRLIDKVHRVYNVVVNKGGITEIKETIQDTLLDIINYAIYGVMLLNGDWDNEK